MIFVRLTLLLAMLLFAALAQAQKLPPDPSRLNPDWWGYFVVDPEKDSDTLATRIEKASERLRSLKEQLPVEERAELIPLIDTIVGNLNRYGKLSGAEQPVPPPSIGAQESYTLAEIQKLVRELRKAGVEKAAEAQDVEMLQQAVTAADREQSQHKVAYLELEETVPERMRLGIELMQTRLQLELARLELRFRSAGLKALENKVDNLQAVLKVAAQRLTATAEAIDAAVTRREEAENKAAAIRARLVKLQLAESSMLALTPLEQARAQLTAQQVVALDVQATTEETLAAQAEVTEILLRRIEADNRAGTTAHRQLLRAYEDRLTLAREHYRQWQRATARNRSTAIKRLADEDDRQVAALLQERVEAADATERDLGALDEQLIVAAQFGDLLDALLIEAEGTVGRGVQVARNWVSESWDTVRQLASASLFEISETPVTTLGLLRVLLIITIAWWVSKLVRRGLQRIASKRESVNQGSVYTLGRVLHYTILAVGTMVALSSIGIDLSKFALFASALGVGIGFGLQTLVSNFVAGLIILFEKSLKIGDFVELESGVTGEVKEINMRSTLITTNDNIDIVVPNSEFVNGRVTNWTMREAFRRMHIPFGVAYGTDKERVKKAVLEAAAEVPLTLTGHKRREPQVWFVEFGDSSLNFELVVWLNPDAVKRPGAVLAAYLWEIDNKLREYDIEVPFPQRDIHIRSLFGQKDEHLSKLLRPQPDQG